MDRSASIGGSSRGRGSSEKDPKDNEKDARDGEDCVDIRESATCTPVAGDLTSFETNRH